MVRHVSTAEAKAKLSELIGSVAYGGDRVLIERRGRPVAALVGLKDVQRIDEAGARTDRPLGALALIGAWADVDDRLIDELISDIYDSRERDAGRPVDLEP